MTRRLSFASLVAALFAGTGIAASANGLDGVWFKAYLYMSNEIVFLNMLQISSVNPSNQQVWVGATAYDLQPSSFTQFVSAFQRIYGVNLNS